MYKSRSKKKRGPRTTAKKVEEMRKIADVETLLADAENDINRFFYDDAAKKLNHLLENDSNNIKALEMLAGIFLEQSNFLEAKNALKKCVELSPEKGPSKYFSLGQLSEGKESLAFYQKGIEVAEKELENIKGAASSCESELLKSISDAYCSVCELFMTDFCYVEKAEEKCLEAVQNAIKFYPNNPDAYLCEANFHLVKGQESEAEDAIQKNLSLWLQYQEELRNAKDGNTEVDPSIVENIPSYDSRIQISKILIELELFQEASTVLDGLIDEDDEVVEVWYLLGWMNYMQGDEYKPNAHYFLNKAIKVKEKIGMEEFDYISHIHELLEELKTDFPLSDSENEEDNLENEENGVLDLSSDSESENKMET